MLPIEAMRPSLISWKYEDREEYTPIWPVISPPLLIRVLSEAE